MVAILRATQLIILAKEWIADVFIQIERAYSGSILPAWRISSAIMGRESRKNPYVLMRESNPTHTFAHTLRGVEGDSAPASQILYIWNHHPPD